MALEHSKSHGNQANAHNREAYPQPNRDPRRFLPSKTTIDLLGIGIVAVLFQAGRFAVREGRHVISGDSVQYVDGAMSILGAHPDAHFGFRKPGYSILLALIKLIGGDFAWSVVAFQHGLLCLLPGLVYLLARRLHSRSAGFVAAAILIAKLQVDFRADKIMTEAVYCVVVTAAILAASHLFPLHSAANAGDTLPPERRRFAASPNGGDRRAWEVAAILAGALLGLAWMFRSIASATILATVLAVAWSQRNHLRHAAIILFFLSAPIFACVGLEMGLNKKFAGAARTSPATLGPTLLLRARYVCGLAFSDSPEALQCRQWLPERESNDAWLANNLDSWVAWHRALRDGMSEWDFDRITRTAAIQALAKSPGSYASSGWEIVSRYFFRRLPPSSISAVPETRKLPTLRREGRDANATTDADWMGDWCLPLRSHSESRALVHQMTVDAQTKAPFCRGGCWPALRYAVMHPASLQVAALGRTLGGLWFGFALLLGMLLRSDRRMLAYAAMILIFDALIVAATAVNAADLPRYASVWIGLESALGAALLVGIAQRAWMAAAGLSSWRKTVRATPQASAHSYPVLRAEEASSHFLAMRETDSSTSAVDNSVR